MQYWIKVKYMYILILDILMYIIVVIYNPDILE